MNKDFLKKIKEKLEEERDIIEKELRSFAEKGKNIKGNWNARHPKFHTGSGGQRLEEEADEVTEYERLLSIEYTFETKLQNINIALGKIEKGEYGICEICKKPIPLKRLEVSPEAKNCLKCRP